MTDLPFLDTPLEPSDVAALSASLGQKGAWLRHAHALGVPVPLGFCVPSAVSRAIARDDDDARARLESSLAELSARTGLALDGDSPLCVAVRASPPDAAPGALPTVLFAGASRASLPGLERRLGSRRAAIECRVRCLRGLERAGGGARPGAVRGGRPTPPSEAELERELAELERAWPPSTAEREIVRAIERVARASDAALVVQVMAFGGARGISGAGVASSRHPITGEAVLFGEIAWDRPGEDLSLGRGAGVSLRRAAAGRRAEESLEARAPELLSELAGWLDRLERAHDRVVDVELAIEGGRLAIVQVRPTVLTPRAEVRVGVELVREGRWSRAEAITRVAVESMARVVRIELAGEDELRRAGCVVLGTGLGASPGAASGAVAIDVGDAVRRAALGERVVLVRSDASPEDAPAVRASVAVATASGGLTSHAAVMSRALGRPCAVSVSNLSVRGNEVTIGGTGRRLAPGDVVTVDGTRGVLLAGAAPVRSVSDDECPRELAGWAREAVPSIVLVEAVPGADPAARAAALGADGVWDGRTVIDSSGSERPELARPVAWEGPPGPLPAGAPILVRADLVAAARLAAAKSGARARDE